MGHLLAYKELYKNRHPSVVQFIQWIRKKFRRFDPKEIDEILPLWSAFLIYKCTTDCPYCVQNYSFKNGRRDSPLKGSLPPESWLLLNNLPNKPEALVITGGEPFLYKKLADVLCGLSGFKQVQVVTNLNIDPASVVEKVRSVTTHRVLFECSYHEESIDFSIFLERANLIKKAGLLGSVRIVDIDPARTRKYIREFALNGIKIQALFQVGMDGDDVLAMENPEASNLIRKPPVLCRTKLVLFAPNGDVYNCHTKLYWADSKSSFGNLTAGFKIPDKYLNCHDYGFCNPCQTGYMEIQVPEGSESSEESDQVLLSNPPPNVIRSR